MFNSVSERSLRSLGRGIYEYCHGVVTPHWMRVVSNIPPCIFASHLCHSRYVDQKTPAKFIAILFESFGTASLIVCQYN